EECDSYTTPIIHHGADNDEMIVAGANQLDAYNPLTGKQLWRLETERRIRTITGPTLANGMVYYAQGFRGPMQAGRLGGSGKLSAKDVVVWKHTQGTPDTPWPVVWKDLLFWVSDDGFAHCLDARTGALKWKERLPGDYKPSPIAADGRIYF